MTFGIGLEPRAGCFSVTCSRMQVTHILQFAPARDRDTARH